MKEPARCYNVSFRDGKLTLHKEEPFGSSMKSCEFWGVNEIELQAGARMCYCIVRGDVKRLHIGPMATLKDNVIQSSSLQITGDLSGNQGNLIVKPGEQS